MSPAEVLLAAADRVQFQGWCQFAYAENSAGRVVRANHPDAVKWCARGALKAEELTPYQFTQTVMFVEDHLNRGASRCYHPWTLMTWNDQPHRTAGEVADTMRRVAKELENGTK